MKVQTNTTPAKKSSSVQVNSEHKIQNGSFVRELILPGIFLSILFLFYISVKIDALFKEVAEGFNYRY